MAIGLEVNCHYLNNMKCPTCGSSVTVAGKTTKYFVTIDEDLRQLVLRLEDMLDLPSNKELTYAEFKMAICNLIGHKIGPDSCGKPEHDHCYICEQSRSKLEKQ